MTKIFKKKKIHFKTFQTLELSNKRRIGSHDNRGSTSLTNKSRKASTMRTPSTSSTEALRTWGKKQSVRHSTNVRFTGPSHGPGNAPFASHSRGSRGLLTTYLHYNTKHNQMAFSPCAYSFRIFSSFSSSGHGCSGRNSVSKGAVVVITRLHTTDERVGDGGVEVAS